MVNYVHFFVVFSPPNGDRMCFFDSKIETEDCRAFGFGVKLFHFSSPADTGTILHKESSFSGENDCFVLRAAEANGVIPDAAADGAR